MHRQLVILVGEHKSEQAKVTAGSTVRWLHECWLAEMTTIDLDTETTPGDGGRKQFAASGRVLSSGEAGNLTLSVAAVRAAKY